MLTSSRVAERERGCRVVVRASSDTEVFLIDHALRLVARAVATLDVQVPPGLYKIKYRQGSRIHDVLQIVEPDKTVIDVAPPEMFRPPAGSADAMAEPPIEIPVRREMFRSRRRAAAPAQQRSVLGITITPGKTAWDFAKARLTILDESGTYVAQFEGPIGSSANGIEFSVPPGTCRLRVESDEGGYEQSVVLASGWRTEVIAKARDDIGKKLGPPYHLDFSDSTILMCGVDDGPPSLEMRRHADSAQAWLAGPQLTIAVAHAQRLVRSDIANPLLALCVAHTLVRQTEIERGLGQPDASDRLRLIASLVDHLRELIPFHPDLSALEIWLERKTPALFALPPMLISSWCQVVAASARQPALVPAGSLSSRMAAHIVTAPIWLQWRSDLIDTTPASRAGKPRAALVEEITERLASLRPQDGEELNDLESAILDRLKRGPGTTPPRAVENSRFRNRSWSRQTSPPVDDLAAALGVPGASVDAALSSILQKLTEKPGASEM